MTITAKPGFFYYEQDGEKMGEVSYLTEDHGQVFTLYHTYVDPSLRGQNIAKNLVDAVVEKARNENKKVRPACRYAAVLFRRFPDDYADVALPAAEGHNKDSSATWLDEVIKNC